MSAYFKMKNNINKITVFSVFLIAICILNDATFGNCAPTEKTAISSVSHLHANLPITHAVASGTASTAGSTSDAAKSRLFGDHHQQQNAITILSKAVAAHFDDKNVDSVLQHVAQLVKRSDMNSPIAGPNFPFEGRLIYSIISLGCLIASSGILFLRLRHFKLSTKLKAVSLLRLVSWFVPCFAVMFVIATQFALLVFGSTDHHGCEVSIWMCLVFYLIQKVLIYVFLNERFHALVDEHKKRRHDIWYIGCFAAIVFGFGTIAVNAFLHPVTSVSPSDGKCRIGLPLRITLSLLIFDIALTDVMTWVAIMNLNTMLGRVVFSNFKDFVYYCMRCLPGRDNVNLIHHRDDILKLFAAWTLMGFALLVIPTIINLAVLVKVKGHEQVWLCYSICTVDVTWAAIMIHWLTHNPYDSSGQRQRRAMQLRMENRPCDICNIPCVMCHNCAANLPQAEHRENAHAHAHAHARAQSQQAETFTAASASAEAGGGGIPYPEQNGIALPELSHTTSHRASI